MEYNLQDMFGITDEVAVITGAASGIAHEVSLGLGRLGARLALVDVDEVKLQTTVDAFTEEGIEAIGITTDITDEDSVVSMTQRVIDTYGQIDILANIAGVLYNQEAVDFDMDKWQWVMDVNVKGTFLTCRSIGRRMLERKKGRIINFSSVRSIQGKDKYHAYAPSKGAVNQLTRTLAVEWAQQGINVNAIAPAYTLTDLNRSLLEDKAMYDWVVGRIPQGRLGEMSWLVGPVVFLASRCAEFVNGAVLYVDGGWTAS